MINLGRTTPEIWEKVEKALKEKFQDIQTENAPYTIIKQVSEVQMLAVQGYYTGGNYDIYLLTISDPALKESPGPVPEAIITNALEEFQEILKEAI